MKVLSLFDGMSCGYLAMQSAGIKVDRYVAFEIDKYAVQTSSHNFPMIEHRGDVFQADFTEFRGFDFLVGGSPCTYWSIAQKNNRETEASGMGWELFSQYVRALKEAQPMFFIYENNKSMSNAIRQSITQTFGFDPVCINSALVSAQNRQRLYWVGRRNYDGTYSRVKVEQPEDRGILLRDILEGTYSFGESNGKSFALTASYWKGQPKDKILDKSQRTHVAEPVNITHDGKSQTLKAQYFKNGVPNFCCYQSTYGASGAAEPVRIPEYGTVDKARPLGANYPNNCGGFEHRMFSENPNKQQVDMIAQPVGTTDDGKAFCMTASYQFGCSADDTLSKSRRSLAAETVRVGALPRPNGELAHHASQAFRIYSADGKSVALKGESGGGGGKTGLYAIPVEYDGDIPVKAVSLTDGKTYIVYEVKDGQITIKEKQYPIKLADGFYIIRKLTVSECKRLQTVPEWYEFPVSDTQAYKMLGNGWTVEVIAHLINATRGDELEDEQLDLFKMVGGYK